MSYIREKESLECVRMHIWASKTQKLPGPLSRPWTPAAECSLRLHDSALLHRQLSASEAGAPPWPNPGSAPARSSFSIKVIVSRLTSCEKNDNFTYFNTLILCVWLQVINNVKFIHRGEGHIKVKVKYLHLFKFYVACTLCKQVVCIWLKCILVRRLDLDFLGKRNPVKMQMSLVFFLIPGHFSQKIATKWSGELIDSGQIYCSHPQP